MNNSGQPQSITAATGIHPATRVGSVALRVRDFDAAVRFYQDALGFRVHRQEGQTAALGAGGADILRLTGDRGAVRASRTAGLYHLAVSMPSRYELARSFHRLVRFGAALQGAADHWFS